MDKKKKLVDQVREIFERKSRPVGESQSWRSSTTVEEITQLKRQLRATQKIVLYLLEKDIAECEANPASIDDEFVRKLNLEFDAPVPEAGKEE